VVLAGGERRFADLVVAADGINSGIRDQLGLLQRRIYGRDCGVRINIPRRPHEIAADDYSGTVMIEAWADKRRVLYCPVTRNEFYVLLTCTMQDKAAAVSPIDPDVWARSFPFMRELFVRRVCPHPRNTGVYFDAWRHQVRGRLFGIMLYCGLSTDAATLRRLVRSQETRTDSPSSVAREISPPSRTLVG
jgi:2-polyprenyl-6-methoxyphenol hydroxylase-like FAD-dependent oxidoreductase